MRCAIRHADDPAINYMATRDFCDLLTSKSNRTGSPLLLESHNAQAFVGCDVKFKNRFDDPFYPVTLSIYSVILYRMNGSGKYSPT